MGIAKIVGTADTSLHKGQRYLAAVRYLDAKQLLFTTEGRGREAVLDFTADRRPAAGVPRGHVTCASTLVRLTPKGWLWLPSAAISYDRCHVVAMAVDAIAKAR